MSNRISLSHVRHKLKKSDGVDGPLCYCPCCDKLSLYVETSDGNNASFLCITGCSQEQVLDSLGLSPDTVVYIDSGSAAGQEIITEEQKQQWFEAFSVSTFPDLVRILKKNNNGSIPQRVGGANLDSLAAAFGYKITSDRKSIYQPPRLSTAASLLQKKLTPPPFAVNGLLPSGLCILSAPPKSYKSWMVLDLCNSVANGTPFMGRNTNKGSVLYLDLEGADYNLQDRMKKMGCSSSDNLQYGFDAPLIGNGLIDFLDDWCKSVENPRLIVIDVLQRVKPMGSSRLNAYENDYSIYGPLNGYAISKGIAIVGVTHNRKSNGLIGDDFELINGSIGQMGSAQTTWLITGKRGIKEEKHFKALGRNIMEIDDLISFDLSSWRWKNHGNAEEAEERKAQDSYATSPIRKTLRELLAESPSCTWRGSYDDLRTQIANRTGEYPAETGRKLGLLMRPMLPLLCERDGIYHHADTNSKKGQYLHTWYRKKLMEE